ncbi:MAG: helix-turn-helix domain-containing protein [Ktedonobacteraceae bacterium]
MQQAIGELIRQARRQHNLTQTELGGTRFSKSYVSAVERNKIMSSAEALRFFAEQLGQPDDYFTSLVQQVENVRQLSMSHAPGLPGMSNAAFQDDALTLLDILLEGRELPNFPARYDFAALSPEVIAALPGHKQSRYYFLTGLIAKEKQDHSEAQDAFECALALAPVRNRPAILDELGVNYYAAKAYQIALGYHLRALHLLQKEPGSGDAIAELRFKVELHCGDDYRALGAYQQAREHYEQARLHLNSEHDMRTAGILYMGLGYCTYVLIHQRTSLVIQADERATFEEMEREFQRAVSFLLQARSVYQVSGDRGGEASARLTLAMALLDFSTRQRQMVQEKARAIGRQTAANCTSLLNDAEEQCRQVLLGWQDPASGANFSGDLDTTIYMALAYLVRIAVQRATLARLGGYSDTAYRERAMASYLCQQILHSLSESSLPWTLMRNAATLQSDSMAYQPPSLPRVPGLLNGRNGHVHSLMSLVEVYFAAGEVAEEIGHFATSHEYSRDSYTRATQCFQAALDVAHLIKEKEYDRSYLVRCYQRCTCILEERMLTSSEMFDETIRTLLTILKGELWELQYPVLDKTLLS